jgi:hypothetical protein
LKKGRLPGIEPNADITLALFPAAGAANRSGVYFLLLCLILNNELDGNSDCFGNVIKLAPKIFINC